MHRSTPSNSQNGTAGLFARFGNGGKTPTTTTTTTTTRPTTGSDSANININTDTSTYYDPLPSQSSSAFTSITRKPSFTLHKSPKNPYQSRRTPSISQLGAASPEKRADADERRSKPPVSLRSDDRSRRGSLAVSTTLSTSTYDSLDPIIASADLISGGPRLRDSFTSTRAYSEMLASYGGPGAAGSNSKPVPYAPGMALPSSSNVSMSPTMESLTYQHIQELASKRISTLDYLRKAHEGRVYWFNTLLFTKADLSKMSYFDVRKLSRRATNYLLLGLSLPSIIDLFSSNALEYLRNLNALLTEFESFQQIHPPDGSSSSFQRARIPQMFKRTIGTTASKTRRASSAAEIGLPYSSSENHEVSSPSAAVPISAFPSSENDLLPGEVYEHLVTPGLPFDPDFYETFATLCDVLIDCYTKLMQLVPSPKECGPAVAEAFTTVDKKVRKIIVMGVVKEFEEASRMGVKAELAGVGKVVLGGLM